jgi:hypothetical protein
MKTAVEQAVDALRLWSNDWNEFDKTGENKPKSIEEVIAPFIQMEKEQSLKKIIYDLDELASEYSEGKSTSEVFKRAHESDFKAGFQKAIELLTFKTTEQ